MDGELGLIDGVFERHHFDSDVVRLCVGWYLHAGLSLRHLVEMLAERGLRVAHTTVLRWVQRCTSTSNRCSIGCVVRPATGIQRVEERLTRVRGRWRYLYYAVDSAGETVDFMLSDKQDMVLAESFFSKVTMPGGESVLGTALRDVEIHC